MEGKNRNSIPSISRELLIELDNLGVIKNISPNCSCILGYDRDKLIGKNIFDFIVEGNMDLMSDYEKNYKVTLKTKYGDKTFDVLSNGSILSLIDTDRLYGGEHLDKRKLLNILELSKDIIYFVQLKPEHKFIYLNSAVEEIIGIPVEEHYKDSNITYSCVHPDDLEIFDKKRRGELDFNEPIQARYRNIHGQYIWLEEIAIPIRDEEGDVVALVGFCRNIQARKELEERLRKLGYYDCLTGIKNRAFFQKELDTLHYKKNDSIGILVCDLDNLKYINDKLGHLQGDKLLKNFAKIIDSFSSEKVVTARIGGDEFVILIKGESYEYLQKIHGDLLREVAKYNSKNKKLPIMVSIGYAYSKTSLGKTKKIFNLADKRMYENKLNNKAEIVKTPYSG